MPIPLLVPALTAAASLASTLFTNRANKKRQEEMNEYNSPANQLARYKAAGMNPGYGAGVSSGNQSSIVQAQAPDVGAAVDSGAKAIAWKEHQQNIKGQQLEQERLAQQIESQRLLNRFASESLDARIESEQIKPKMLEYQTLGTQFDAGSKEVDMLWKRALNDKGFNPLNQDFLYKRAATAASEIANKLQTQLYNYRDKANPLQYQMNAQQFHQNEIINPLRVITERLRSEGVRDSDPLMIRLMALQYLAGKPQLSHPLMPAAGAAAVGGILPKLLKF